MVGGQEGEDVIVPSVAREGAGRAAVRHLVRVRVRVRARVRIRVGVASPSPSQLLGRAAVRHRHKVVERAAMRRGDQLHLVRVRVTG